jgi:hypothetical protein
MGWEGVDWMKLAQDRDHWGRKGICEHGNEFRVP